MSVKTECDFGCGWKDSSYYPAYSARTTRWKSSTTSSRPSMKLTPSSLNHIFSTCLACIDIYIAALVIDAGLVPRMIEYVKQNDYLRCSWRRPMS